MFTQTRRYQLILATLKCMFSVSPAQVCVESQELFAHLPSSVMAHANMSRESQTQVPELSALQALSKDILTQCVETRGILDALCQVLMDSGLVRKEKLLAEVHRQSFAAVRRTHQCDWNLSLCCASSATGMLRTRLLLVS